MIRRIAVAATTAALTLGTVAAVATPAGAAKPIITATGNVTCSALNGKIKFSPALSNVNTSPTLTTAKVKGTCTGSTESGVTPTALKAVVTSQGTSPGTCSGLVSAGATPFTVDIPKWKASGGKINPSQIIFPSASPEGGGYGLHDGDVSGSYAGTDNADAQVDVDLGAVVAALTTPGICDPNDKGKTKGFKKLTVTGGTLTIT